MCHDFQFMFMIVFVCCPVVLLDFWGVYGTAADHFLWHPEKSGKATVVLQVVSMAGCLLVCWAWLFSSGTERYGLVYVQYCCFFGL